MATYCPNCSRKLKITDWHQNCPECGVNLMFSDFEKRFFEDAKRSELGRARVRVWWTKVLAAFIGGKLQISRLISILLPVAALLAPFCGLKTELPLYTDEISAGLIGFVGMVTGSDPLALTGLREAPVIGGTVSAAVLVFAAFAGALACAALVIVSQLVSVVTDKAATVLILVFSALGAVFCGFGVYAAATLKKVVSLCGDIFEYSGGFGQFIAAAAFVTVFTLNIILLTKGYEIRFKDGDLYRTEIYRELKKGRITLEELPYPITETEEEKAERLRAIEDTVNGKSPNGEVNGK